MINVGIIGATGLVGEKMIDVIEERGLDVNLRTYASRSDDRKTGKYSVEKLEEVPDALDFALFSAGSAVSKEWIPRFVKKRIICIDNSSEFRRIKGIPLVVPEINFSDISKRNRIISNPNCSTIPVVRVLHPFIEKVSGFTAVTFQSVSGVGRSGIEALKSERKGLDLYSTPFEKKIFNNVIPQIGNILDAGWTEEERKMSSESRKILHKHNLNIAVTCVRVPVEIGHSISLTVEGDFEDISFIDNKLNDTEDIWLTNVSMPKEIVNSDDIIVGRLREEYGFPGRISMFICADNLRVGAATNAVKILERLI